LLDASIEAGRRSNRAKRVLIRVCGDCVARGRDGAARGLKPRFGTGRQSKK
jgi:hypothetical protein